MCTHNGEHYWREQLNSLIGQTYPIREILIQDDQSTDQTMKIIKEYQAMYSNIRF
jgi:glycosyltransferase involved in cell wall biosynthesis